MPVNKKAVDSKIPEFKLPQEIAEMEPEDWLMLTKENFQRLFQVIQLEERILISQGKYPEGVGNIAPANRESASRRR